MANLISMLDPIFHTTSVDQKDSYEKFVFEPLHSSFASSLGNGLRRTLLSSMKGAAVSYVKVSGVPHLFSTIKGVKESVLDIVMNLKQVSFAVTGEDSYKVTLTAKGEGKVYAKDIKGDAEVVNPDFYIAELTDKSAELEVEAIIDTNYGYVPAEEKEEYEQGYTAIDSSYSPVKQVNFKVEEARVGRKSNFERLILEVWTNGSVTPREALEESSKILSGHFVRIYSGQDAPIEVPEESENSSKADNVDSKVYDTIIDELNLPSRVINALLRENIETIDDLLKRGKENLVGLKGVGRKSIDLIDDELKKMGVELV